MNYSGNRLLSFSFVTKRVTSAEDPVLEAQIQRTVSLKSALQRVKDCIEVQNKRIASLGEASEELSRSLNELYQVIEGDKEALLLGNCSLLLSTLQGNVGMMCQELPATVDTKVLAPLDAFLKEELAAVVQSKASYDKMRQALEMAEQKVMSMKGKEESAKAFLAEQERNSLQTAFKESKELLQTTVSEATEKNKVFTLDWICEYALMNRLFFQEGLNTCEAILPHLKEFKETASKGREKVESGTSVEATSGTTNDDVIYQGWLRPKKVEGLRGVKKTWVVVKHKFIYCYNNPEDKTLLSVIPLVHCCVKVLESKKNAFAINGRLNTTVFALHPYSNDLSKWQEAIQSAIEDHEDHSSRLSGKEETKGLGNIPEIDNGSDSEEEVFDSSKDPAEVHCQNFIQAERRFIRKVHCIATLYMDPIGSDPKLMAKLTPSEFEVMFMPTTIEGILDFHESLLDALNEANAATIGTILLEAMNDFEAVYLPYVSKLHDAIVAIESAPKVVKTYLVARAQQLQGQYLPRLLTLPLQRLSQYKTFIQTLMYLIEGTTCERDPILVAAIEMIDKIQIQMEKNNALSLNVRKLITIQNIMTGYPKNLVNAKRVLIKEGEVTLRTREGKMRVMIYLFNDILILAKISRLNTHFLEDVELFKATVANHDKDKENHHFDIVVKQRGKHSPPKVLPIFCSSAQEKMAWIDAISASVEAMAKNVKVFGVSLEMVMANPMHMNKDIPIIIERVTDWLVKYGLKQEGIFRMPAGLDELEEFKDRINRGENIQFTPTVDVYVMAGLITHYLVDLPEPLLTKALFPVFVDAVQYASTDYNKCILSVTEALKLLPFHNKMILQHLMALFQLVIAEEASNKMGAANLAIVFGPTLMGCQSAESMFNDFKDAQGVIEFMITNYNPLFKEIENERSAYRSKHEEEALMKMMVEKANQEQLNNAVFQRRSRNPASIYKLDKTGLLFDGAKMAEVSAIGGSMMDRPLSPKGTLRASDVIVKEGWLSKKGGQRRNWNTRWCVLKMHEFAYYKSKKDVGDVKKCKGKVLLAEATVLPSQRKQFCFGLATAGRTYLLAAKDAAECDDWVEHINNCLSRFPGRSERSSASQIN